MSNLIELTGVITKPAEMSIGGEHTKCWSIRVVSTSYNSQSLMNKKVCINHYNGINNFSGKKVKLTGVYEGVHGVTSKQHKVKPVRIEFCNHL